MKKHLRVLASSATLRVAAWANGMIVLLILSLLLLGLFDDGDGWVLVAHVPAGFIATSGVLMGLVAAYLDVRARRYRAAFCGVLLCALAWPFFSLLMRFF